MEYGAIDLHTRYSEVRVITEAGDVVVARRVRTRPEAFAAIFGARPRLRILLETGTESEWVATLLEGWGHEVIVADPNYAPMYGDRRRRVKTDRRDVAALVAANCRGLFRPAHRTSAAQRQVRRELTVRTTLVRMRTQIINVVRSVVRATGARIPSGASTTFRLRVQHLALPAEVRTVIAPLLDQLETLDPAIAAADRRAAGRATADPVTVRLMTAPGVGPITALQLRATLDRVDRFASAAAASSYLGLVPREYSSGEQHRRGGITKAGARAMRALLVQASWVVWRIKRGPGATLAAWAHRLADRRGRRVAIVAVARRLVRILFALWRDECDFREPRPVTVAA